MRTTTARLLALIVVVFGAGCATAPHRARQYSAEYDALPEETQKRATHGYIREGDTAETVYIAMGPPQSREKVNNGGVFEEHWIYLGRPAPGQNVLEPGNYRFITVNDMSWSNPFDASTKNQRIHVVFLGETVLRVDIEDDDGAALIRPEMTMPRR